MDRQNAINYLLAHPQLVDLLNEMRADELRWKGGQMDNADYDRSCKYYEKMSQKYLKSLYKDARQKFGWKQPGVWLNKALCHLHWSVPPEEVLSALPDMAADSDDE